MAGQALNSPVVGIASTPAERGIGRGSLMRIFGFADAANHGSTGSLRLVAPIVGMTSTPDGRAIGSWQPTAGSSASGMRPSAAVWAGEHSTDPSSAWPPTGNRRILLVAANGGIFSFGAPFFGSTGSFATRPTIVGMEAVANGAGY